jgi:hypothetical protein
MSEAFWADLLAVLQHNRLPHHNQAVQPTRLVLVPTTKEDTMANKEQKSNSNNKKEAKLSLKEKRLKKAEKKKA